MEVGVLVGIAGVFFLLQVAVLLLFFWRNNSSDKGEQSLSLLQGQIQDLARTLDTKIGETSKEVNESVRVQVGESNRIIRDVTERLIKLDETNKQVVSFADQLRSLQDILKNPKQRGVLGEYYLETVLKNVLPPGSYKMQYSMGKDEEGKELIPDAVVFVKDRVIPVDSKFSLENYNRLTEASEKVERDRLEKVFVTDLKNRIVETSKYIQPEKKTMEFAFMFIPHEAIYYDLLVNRVGAGEENLIQRAASKYKVIIVSPTSFLAYLQTVLQGLHALQVEEQAQDIIKRVGELGRHVGKYEEYYKKLGNALSTTVNHYNSGYKELGKIDKDVMRIAESTSTIEPEALERPIREE